MNKVARLECWEGRQRLDWGLNRGREGGRGLPPKKAKYGHHRERATKLSPARIARRCERTKLHPLSLYLSDAKTTVRCIAMWSESRQS